MSSKTIQTVFAIVMTLALTMPATQVQASTPSEPPLIQSDTPMALDDLVALALDHEYTYRKAVEGEKIVLMLRASAIGQFLPTVSASGTYSTGTYYDYPIYNDDDTFLGRFDYSNSNSSTSISIRETIFAGGQRLWGLKSAKLQLENIFLSSERSRDVLIAQVKTAVYNFLLAEENLSIQKETLEQRKESLRLATTRYETGDVIELDVMQAEIDLGNQANLVLQAKQGLENAREAVNLSVGIHLDSKFPIDGDLTPVLPASSEQLLVNTALQQRPDYMSAKNMVKINRMNTLAYTSQYLPTVTWFMNSNRGYYSPDSKGDYQYWPEDRTGTTGFSLNWTIFDGFQREYNRQSAIIEKRKAIYDEFSARQNIMAQVRSEWRNLDNLYQQIQVLDQNRDLARRQLELEQERYRVGASDQLSLRNAQVTFSQAENNYLGRVLDFFITLATLERDISSSLEEVSR